jgi:ketosteroid isomerase-like protein
LFRNVDDALGSIHADLSEVLRDEDGQIVAAGLLRTRGKASGAVTELPLGWVVDFKDGKALRVRTYQGPEEALEAAGPSE